MQKVPSFFIVFCSVVSGLSVFSATEDAVDDEIVMCQNARSVKRRVQDVGGQAPPKPPTRRRAAGRRALIDDEFARADNDVAVHQNVVVSLQKLGDEQPKTIVWNIQGIPSTDGDRSLRLMFGEHAVDSDDPIEDRCFDDALDAFRDTFLLQKSSLFLGGEDLPQGPFLWRIVPTADVNKEPMVAGAVRLACTQNAGSLRKFTLEGFPKGGDGGPWWMRRKS